MDIQVTGRAAGTRHPGRWLITALTVATAMIATVITPVEAASAAAAQDFTLTLKAADIGVDPAVMRELVPQIQAEIAKAGSLGNAIMKDAALYPRERQSR